MTNIESDIRPEDIAEVKHVFGSETRKALRKTAALALVGAALSGPMVGEVRAENGQVPSDDTTIETAGVMPSINEFALTVEYGIKMGKIIKYKEELLRNECRLENLDFCAGVLYSVDESTEIQEKAFDHPERTILKKYLSRETVIEFGKTGKGLDVIYFKDEKGKKTNIPAICYVAGSEIKKTKIEVIDEVITKSWKDAPNFLEALVANDVRVLFQNQAAEDNDLEVFKYETGIIYFNSGSNIDKKFLMRGLAVEMFGVKGEALGGPFRQGEVGVIKSILMKECCRYLADKTGKDIFFDMIKKYQIGEDRYMKMFGFSTFYIDGLVEKIKAEGLMTPFGAESWEEVDSVKK